jgi:hypothetical protein
VTVAPTSDRVVLSLREGRFVARLLECQFDLPKFLAGLGLPRGQGAQRGPNAERLQTPVHLSTNGAVNAHPAERNAPIAAMIQMPATAVIAPGAVGDGPQRSRPASNASPCRTDPRLMKLLPLALSLIRRWFLSNSAQSM